VTSEERLEMLSMERPFVTSSMFEGIMVRAVDILKMSRVVNVESLRHYFRLCRMYRDECRRLRQN